MGNLTLNQAESKWFAPRCPSLDTRDSVREVALRAFAKVSSPNLTSQWRFRDYFNKNNLPPSSK